MDGKGSVGCEKRMDWARNRWMRRRKVRGTGDMKRETNWVDHMIKYMPELAMKLRDA